MALTDEHLIEMEDAILDTIITALEQSTLPSDDMPELSTFILDRFYELQTEEELVAFLRELSSKWRIFTHVLVLETGEAREQREAQLLKHALSLMKEKKIDEALAVAKTGTKGAN